VRDFATAAHVGAHSLGRFARAFRRTFSVFRSRQAIAVVVALAFVLGAVADGSGVRAAPPAGPLSSLEVTDLTVGGNNVYAATSDGVFRTLSDGTVTTWTPLSLGLPAGSVAAIAFEPTSQRVFAAAPGGLYVLNPGSTSWQSTAIAVPPSGSFSSLTFYGPRLAYLGTTTGAVLKVDVTTSTSVVISGTGRGTKVGALVRVGDLLIVGDQNSVWECNVAADTCVVPTAPQLLLAGPANRLATIQGTVFVATTAGISYRQPTWASIPISNAPGAPVTALQVSGNVVTVAVSVNGRTTLKRSNWDASLGQFSAWVAFGSADSLPETRSLASAGQSSIWAGTTSGPYLHAGTTVAEVSDVGVVATLTTTVTPTTGPTSTPAPTGTALPTETKTSTPTATVTATTTPSPTATSAVPTRVPAAAAPLLKTRVPTGGGVAIASDGLASVAIPAAALSGEVEVSMVPLVRPDPAGVIRYRSQLFFGQAVVDLSDTRSVAGAPIGQHPEEATYLAVAGSPYDVRLVDVATGRELRAVPPSVDLGIVYRLEDLPRGTTEFGLFLGRWDELARVWVPLPTRQDPDHRLLHAPLTSPSIVSVLVQAPVMVPTTDGNRYVGLTSQFVAPSMVDAVAGAGGLPRTGLPIAPQDATGAQLFQNARLEVDATTGVARFGNLGSDFVTASGLTFPETPDAGMIQGMRYFPDTSRYVSDAIIAYYDAINGAVSLGLPISPETPEGSVFAQYFERGKVTIDPASLVVSVAPLGEDMLKLQVTVKPVAAEGEAAP
jgi:hypothetical protein